MDDVAICEDELKPRFNQAQTIKVPVSLTTMRVYKLGDQMNPPDLVAVQGQQAPLCDEDEGSADMSLVVLELPPNLICLLL